MSGLKGSQYLIVVAGMVVVLGVIFTVSYKQNVIFSCDLVDKYYDEFSYHILNALYSVERLDEGRVMLYIGDNFRYVLDGEKISIYYQGSCKTNRYVVVRDHRLENAVYSTYEGRDFCVEKLNNRIRLC